MPQPRCYVTTALRHDGRDAVVVDVADCAQAHALYMLYFHYDHRARELEFRKRHGGCEIEEGIHDGASKSKGQDIVSVLPAVTCPV